MDKHLPSHMKPKFFRWSDTLSYRLPIFHRRVLAVRRNLRFHHYFKVQCLVLIMIAVCMRRVARIRYFEDNMSDGALKNSWPQRASDAASGSDKTATDTTTQSSFPQACAWINRFSHPLSIPRRWRCGS
jgi:hypothetical protein